MCAKIVKIHDKRSLACFPLKGAAVVLGQDQSGLSKQVTAQGGVLKITVFGTPDGYRNLLEKAEVQ